MFVERKLCGSVLIMKEIVKISTEFITLGQLLKVTTIASTGGMVKMILAEYDVFVNGELESQRGKKLYDGDVIEVEEVGQFQIEHDHNTE